MNSFQLKHLTSQELLSQTRSLVQKERVLTLQFLWHLKEIESRRLHLELGYSSLYAFVQEEYKYSSGSTHRRIESMRLLKECPEIQSDLLSGELTLTNVSQAAVFFKTEAKAGNSLSMEQKTEIINELKGKSTREVERKLLAKSSKPQDVPKEQERAITENLTEYKFVANEELVKKLNELKNLMSHKNLAQKNNQMSFQELVSAMADMTLKQLRKKNVISKRVEKAKATKAKAVKTPAPGWTQKRSRYISKAIRYQVFEKSKNACTFTSPLTGRVCGSKFLLELEHLVPFALGGENNLENLTVRCRSHNQHAAIKVFGMNKMEKYLDH
jgi:5-methylcytosine-specific restriction endonuclease McrA